MNHISLIGRITKDLTVEKTNQGKAYCRFSLAVNDGKVDGQDIAYFFDCIAWEKKAEVIAQYCAKGHLLAVEGKLTQKRTEKDGKQVTYYTIVVQEITFIQPKEDKPQFDTGSKKVVNEADDLPF